MYNFHATVCFTGHLHLTEGLRTTLLFNLGVVGGQRGYFFFFTSFFSVYISKIVKIKQKYM